MAAVFRLFQESIENSIYIGKASTSGWMVFMKIDTDIHC